jgi:serine/threonine-protein kinase
MSSPSARAQGTAAAQTLFDGGKRSMAEGRYEQACEKFEESQRLDPGLGTLFHLADCEEKLGRTATAWASFLDVASGARSRGEAAREAAARDRAKALEPLLAKMVVDPATMKDTPGLELTRDGVLVGPGQWGTAVPVDPGPHRVQARAPGKEPWAATVVATAGAIESLTIPTLPDALPVSGDVASVATTSAEVPRRGTGNVQRAVGAIAGIAGLAGLAVGASFGALSWIRHDDADPHCGASGCDASGVALRNDAIRAGDVATVSLAAGGGVLLLGVVTYATAPHARDSSAATKRRDPVVLCVGPGWAGLGGVW